MYRLTQFIRNTPFAHLQSTIRGPKKKKGQASGTIQSTDIINIFKQRTDPQPLNIRQYPTFVQQFSLGDNSIHQIQYGAMLDIKTLTPNQSTYKSFLRGIKRQRCKSYNQFHHLDHKPDVLSEKHDPNHRKAIYNIFVKAAEDLEAKQQLEREAAMEEEDDEE